MIRYALKCSRGHAFDSWFASAEAFDSLRRAKQVSCPFCNDTDVSKSLMAPGVQSSRSKAAPPAADGAADNAPAPAPGAPAPVPAPSGPPPALREKLAAMRAEVEANSEYVGLQFASEARAMHEGDMPHRPIYGEAKAEDAKKLLQDGVPVAPLPFVPTRKVN